MELPGDNNDAVKKAIDQRVKELINLLKEEKKEESGAAPSFASEKQLDGVDLGVLSKKLKHLQKRVLNCRGIEQFEHYY